MSNRRATEAGFTLIEAIAAFALTAVALGVLLSLLSDSLGREERATRIQTASLLAESKLAEVGLTDALRQGEATGKYANGYVWTVRTEPATEILSRSDVGVEAYWVDVTVGWGGDRKNAVSLRTLKLGLKDPA